MDIPTALRKLFKTVDAYNQAIDDARNVELPGTRLTSDIEQAIKAAETPLNIVVPGLGTLTGIIGNAGVSLISNMLADKREETASELSQNVSRSVLEMIYRLLPLSISTACGQHRMVKTILRKTMVCIPPRLATLESQLL